MEGTPQIKPEKTEELGTKGMIVFREGRRLAVRKGDIIDFYFLNGQKDPKSSPEPITMSERTTEQGQVFDIYDVNDNKIGSELITAEN